MAETVKLQWSETRSDTRCAPSKRGYKDICAHIYTNAESPFHPIRCCCYCRCCARDVLCSRTDFDTISQSLLVNG